MSTREWASAGTDALDWVCEAFDDSLVQSAPDDDDQIPDT
jgi:hypothetical protein